MAQIILIGTQPKALLNFRGTLIKALIDRGNEVTTMASQTEADENVTHELKKMGATFRTYPVQRNGLNPLADLKTFKTLRQTLQHLHPDVLLAYTIKPILWGGLASRFIPKIRFYALITGLGFAFQGNTFKRKVLRNVVTPLYRLSLSHASKVIFQNPDNLAEFVSRNIVLAAKCILISGSGVDVGHYAQTSLPSGRHVFLTIGRLLGEKGFREYAQAAQIVKAKYPETIFQLLGHEDPSPDGIPMSEVNGWHQDGYLEYLGSTTDVRPYLVECNVFVLPSYHEGLPRTTMEAMAIGRPILTTDVPGCRETVISGENGYLVPKANAEALAERMIWFIENRDQCERMGKRSRELAEEKYDVHKINKQLMEVMGLMDNVL